MNKRKKNHLRKAILHGVLQFGDLEVEHESPE
jgi:hypothetical protein